MLIDAAIVADAGGTVTDEAGRPQPPPHRFSIQICNAGFIVQEILPGFLDAEYE